jgi:hypothetical protein
VLIGLLLSVNGVHSAKKQRRQQQQENPVARLKLLLVCPGSLFGLIRSLEFDHP